MKTFAVALLMALSGWLWLTQSVGEAYDTGTRFWNRADLDTSQVHFVPGMRLCPAKLNQRGMCSAPLIEIGP